MQNQSGSTIIIALVLLTLVSLVAVYSLESSGIQSKMVNNSLFSTLTYQECRNEQEAQIRDLNEATSVLKDDLTQTSNLDPELDPVSVVPFTTQRADYSPKSTEMTTTWSYIGEDSNIFQGSSLGTFTALVFQNNCNAKFRFSSNTQSMGVAIKALKNSTFVR